MDTLAGVFLVTGSVFVMLAGVGVVRFPDIYSRMHAAAKGPTLGVLLIGVGTILAIGTVAALTVIVLIVLLQLLAGPVGTHLLGRSVYHRMRPPLDGADELADRDDLS